MEVVVGIMKVLPLLDLSGFSKQPREREQEQRECFQL